MTVGRWLLNRRRPAAPVVDVGVEPSPTLTTAAIGRGVWWLVDTDQGAPPPSFFHVRQKP